MPKPKLFLFDANSFCYRAFFALGKNLSTSYGQPTGAIFGFVNILNRILRENNPDYVSVCFDVSKETFRNKQFKDYKKERPPMPDELVTQIPIIKEIISAYNFCIHEKEGFEADDVIATIAKKLEKKFDVFVVSGDKDMMQLVNDHIKIYNPYHKNLIIDKKAVFSKFGIKPENMVDLMALMGDAADNIPGVKGIGEKTAGKLVKKYSSIDNLLMHIDEVMPLRIRDLIKNQKDMLIMSRKLVILHTSVPLELDFAKLKVIEPDYDRLRKIFKKLELKGFLNSMPQSKNIAVKKNVVELEKKTDIENFIKRIKDVKLVIFLLDFDSFGGFSGIYFYQDDKIYYADSKVSNNLKDILQDKEIKKIGFNLKEAKGFLAKNGIGLSGLYFDVMLAAYILDPARGSYELNDLVFDYLGNDVTEDTGKNIVFIPKLQTCLLKELKAKNQDKLFLNIEMPLVDVLYQMETRGVRIDLKFLSSMAKELDGRISSLQREIYKIAEEEFNISSPKQLRVILFDKLKLPVVKKTKTGPSTDEEVLRRLSKNHSLPGLILDYRQLVKLKSTYIDPLPKLVDRDAYLHASFNQTGTQTGRLSCSGPNLQNIPVKTQDGKRVRRAFIPGNLSGFFLSCDYSQIELRILAHLSNDAALRRTFSEGKDVHRYTASLIFSQDEKDIDDVMRNMAKRVNFGIIYGMTSFGLSKDLGISVDEAQKFIDDYFLRYPDVKKYIDTTIMNAQNDGFVTTLLGRRRYLSNINSKNNQLKLFAQRQAINAPIQGTASDMIKLAMVSLSKEIKEKKFVSEMILQVHDELIFDVKKDELNDLAILVKSNMESVLELSVPIEVDMKMGINWQEMESLVL
ncbi:MAG TPA: DNA polymerase I [Candidatus Omnitrophica bacterium]|nr:DNA polymerase I [Candidatus Omnitrophota bacterium]